MEAISSADTLAKKQRRGSMRRGGRGTLASPTLSLYVVNFPRGVLREHVAPSTEHTVVIPAWSLLEGCAESQGNSHSFGL